MKQIHKYKENGVRLTHAVRTGIAHKITGRFAPVLVKENGSHAVTFVAN